MAKKAILKINREEYQKKIDKLKELLGRLDTTVTKYEHYETSMDSFIDSTDDNYNKLRANIEQNIETVRKEQKLTQAAIESLEQTLQDQDLFDVELDKAIDTAADRAKELVDAAVKTAVTTLFE